MFRLDNKVAVVTGAGSGIGLAIAQTLARAGCKVALIDRDQAAIDRAADDINKGQDAPAARAIVTDVSDESSVRDGAAAVLSHYARCDILVNNAGIGHVGTVLSTAPGDLDRLYSVNVRGLMLMTQAFLPPMLARGAGSVINMASVAGVVAVKDRFAYTTTKFAVVGMTKAMAADHTATGVRFNAVCPGRVLTPFVEARIQEYPDPQAAFKEMASTQLLNRMGKPEEIAALVLYLASDESKFVTGSAVLIDGGMSAV